MTDEEVLLVRPRLMLSGKPDDLRDICTWVRNRLVREHGIHKGERMFREISQLEVIRLWQKEGPGKLDIN